jgi:hypothetical protein
MQEQLSPWRFTTTLSIALAVGIVVSGCCPKAPSAPAPAQGCPKGSPPQSEQELRACLRSITFDTAYEVSDSQPLTFVDTAAVSGTPTLPCPGDSTASRRRCRYGPLAKIEPVIGGQRYSDSELMEGRIVAKLWIPRSEREGYPKYNLTPGDSTYWWVKTDANGQTGTSLFIALENGRVVRPSNPRPLHREPYTQSGERGNVYEKVSKYWRAAARWIWTLIDETAKVKCGSGSCS